MEKYTYDYALDCPGDFATALAPIKNVPVLYNDVPLPCASLDEHGHIQLELPAEVVSALRRRTAFVCPFFDFVGVDRNIARRLSKVEVRDYFGGNITSLPVTM